MQFGGWETTSGCRPGTNSEGPKPTSKGWKGRRKATPVRKRSLSGEGNRIIRRRAGAIFGGSRRQSDDQGRQPGAPARRLSRLGRVGTVLRYSHVSHLHWEARFEEGRRAGESNGSKLEIGGGDLVLI